MAHRNIMEVLQNKYPDKVLNISCPDVSKDFKTQYDTLVWNDDIPGNDNPVTKPTYEELLIDE
jgi:hypothetical protein